LVAGRIYLLLCYSKGVKSDLTEAEKKESKKVIAYLKGAQ